MVSVLDALRARMTQRTLNAIDTVAAAARAAARGERYDIGALETAIDQAGLTMPQFEQAVETARRRAGWMADFEKLAVASGKVAKLETAAEAEKTKFEATRAAYLERVTAIDAEAKVHRTTRDRGQAAKNHLLDPAHVPGTIGERYREAVEAAAIADRKVDAARSAVREQEQRIKSEEGWIKNLTNEQAGIVQPVGYLNVTTPPRGESLRLQEHRTALARAQRRHAEAKSQLDEAENHAALAHATVDQLIPEVLKA